MSILSQSSLVLASLNACTTHFATTLKGLTMLNSTGFIILAFIMSLPVEYVRADEQPLFVGTHVAERGIYASTIDLATGEFGTTSSVGDAPRPGFLALHPHLPLLYAVTQETGKPSGGVRVFQFTPQSLALESVGQVSTEDEGATHLALDSAGKKLVVVHYSGGSTALVPVSDEGKIDSVSDLVRHSGSSVNPQRQGEPHAHGVAFDSSGQFACVADLGTDEVIVYRLEEGKLTRCSAWKAAPGAGPRHVAFHPNGRWLYCVNELNSTLNALAFDADSGELSEMQTIGTLPDDFEGTSYTAEVVVHPNGRFVYISNRGHDSTTVFAIHAETGALSVVEFEPTGGGHPRSIGIDPSGRFLIAANRDANNLVSFHLDSETGKLLPTGYEVTVPQPVCVVFPSM